MNKLNIISYLRKGFLDSDLLRSYRTARKNLPAFLLTMLVDLVFVATFVLFNWSLTQILPNPEMMLAGAAAKVVVSLLELMSFAAVVIAVYSLLKLTVISRIKGMFGKTSSGFPLFGRFYTANLALIAMALAVFAIFSAAFIFTIRIDLLTYVRDSFFTLFSVLLYITFNTMHSLFAQGTTRTGRLFSMTFDMVFVKMKRYIGIILFSVVAFFILSGAYYLLDWAVLHMIGSAMEIGAVYLSYAIFNTLLVFVVMSGLVAFNRVYFYTVVLNNDDQH